MKVLALGFNRYELFTRRLAFQMATGERQFVLTDSIEDCLAHPNSLVIVTKPSTLKNTTVH